MRRIHWHETVGELGALLLESRLVKECQPIHNRRLRRSSELCTWQLVQVLPGECRLTLVSGQATDFVRSEDLFGIFANRREATETLRKMAAAHQLCPIAGSGGSPRRERLAASGQRAQRDRDPKNPAGSVGTGAVRPGYLQTARRAPGKGTSTGALVVRAVRPRQRCEIPVF